MPVVVVVLPVRLLSGDLTHSQGVDAQLRQSLGVCAP